RREIEIEIAEEAALTGHDGVADGVADRRHGSIERPLGLAYPRAGPGQGPRSPRILTGMVAGFGEDAAGHADGSLRRQRPGQADRDGDEATLGARVVALEHGLASRAESGGVVPSSGGVIVVP